MADFVCRNLFKYLKRKVGLICDNYENMPSEQMNLEREKRLNNIVRNELDEGDYLWKNLEMEETQLKVEVTDNIMDQLYNEIIEILEHIQLNRNKSEIFNNDLFMCESNTSKILNMSKMDSGATKKSRSKKNMEKIKYLEMINLKRIK